VKADKAVFIGALMSLAFLLGMHAAATSPKQCPSVEGMEVTSSRATSDGEFCTYQPVSPAHRKHQLKLEK
jgi:hypothetical protein